MRILHLLGWHLSDIENILGDIHDSGFDFIQINPIQTLKDGQSSDWWMSYQPINFNIGNQYGSRNDLINLCFEANKYGIRVIADVVCNHMAGVDSGELYPHHKVASYLKDHSYYWKHPVQVENWDDRYQVINHCMGLPGLNISHPDIQNYIFDFISDLVNCGVSGVRLDAAKSIALPEEGCDFFRVIRDEFHHRGVFVYGEILFGDPNLIYQYTNYISVLTESWDLSSDSIVNFVESHDSFYHLGYTKDLNHFEINNRYRQLTDMSSNTLYFARPFEDVAWQNEHVRDSNYQRVKSYTYKN